jgi:acetyl esterase/lipase
MTQSPQTPQELPPSPFPPDLSEVYAVRPEQEMVIDLYLPKRAHTQSLSPIVLFVHGGGWQGGSRRQFHWHARQLADLGYLAGSISYRLAGVAPYPACIDDTQAAVRWLKKHAARFGADPDRVGALGSSAGGHLVAMIATRDTLHDNIPDLAGISSRVNCVIDIHGVHDVAAWLTSRNAQNDPVRIAFMGGPIGDPNAHWHDASPLFFVDNQTTPILFTHDKGDTNVNYEQSARMVQAMVEHERPCAFIPTPGSGHGFVYSHTNPWTQKLWPDIVAWFARHLNP